MPEILRTLLSLLTASSEIDFTTSILTQGGLPRWLNGKESSLPCRTWSLGGEDPLEKRMATHSNIHVWQILWTEESGGLQSMKLKKSQNDLATKPPANLGWFDVKIHILFTSYVSSDLKNRGKNFWQAQMQKWDGRIRAIENNFLKNEHKYFCFKSWHESRKVFQKHRNENSCPNFTVFNFLKRNVLLKYNYIILVTIYLTAHWVHTH